MSLLDRHDNLRHDVVNVTVDQSARVILQNQANSQAFKAWFDTLTDVAIKQFHVAK